MGDTVQIFKNKQFGEIRVLNYGGKEKFVGSDIAKALGYSIPSKAINTHCKGVSKMEVPTNGGTQEMLVISEGDIYRLITHSKLPLAEKFESWVFDDVLPQIRKTGGYIPTNENDTDEDILAKAVLIANKTIEKKNQIIEVQKKQLEEQHPKVIFADAVSASKSSILIGELAKILKQNGVDSGQNKLFQWLRDNGYLIKRKGTDYNMPTQRSMEQGLFEIKETSVSHSDGHISVNKTSKVTGKGQQYFINKFLSVQAMEEVACTKE